MKSLATLLPALLGASILTAQTGPPPQCHAPILAKAEYHAGDTARFTFSGTVHIQPKVNPRFANASGPTPRPRQYRLEGAMVATFLGMPTGQVLSGALRFENLRVKDYASESDVKELESRLQQMEANSWTISRQLIVTGTRVVPQSDPYTSDLDALLSLAQLALIPQMGDQPLSPGDRKNTSRIAGPGSITPGAQTQVAIEYVADVPVNGRSYAEFRVTTTLPLQQLPSQPEWAARLAKEGVHPLSRASSDTAATYLYAGESHEFIFLRLQSRVNVLIEAESGDANAPVRIPVTLVTHNVETAFSAKREVEPASAAREADLAAFEKTLEQSSASATSSSVAVDNSNTSIEMSLGDLARKTRAQNEAQGKPSRELILEGSASGAGGPVSPGFKTFTHPNGGMTALLPDESRPLPADKEGGIQRFVARVGSPPVMAIILMGQGPSPSCDAASSGSMDIVVQGVLMGLGSKARLVRSNDTTLGGRPARIAEFVQDKTPDKPSLRGLTSVAAAIDGKSLGVLLCASSESDFPTAESACRTIVESMRMP